MSIARLILDLGQIFQSECCLVPDRANTPVVLPSSCLLLEVSLPLRIARIDTRKGVGCVKPVGRCDHFCFKDHLESWDELFASVAEFDEKVENPRLCQRYVAMFQNLVQPRTNASQANFLVRFNQRRSHRTSISPPPGYLSATALPATPRPFAVVPMSLCTRDSLRRTSAVS